MDTPEKASFKGNPLLKGRGFEHEWTPEQLEEYKKCMSDPIYFIETYITILSLDEGLIKFKLFEYQKKMLGIIHDNRFSILKIPRQSGKTISVVAYILWYVLFNDNMNVAIMSDKEESSKKILNRLKLALENLPKWLQQGILEYNKKSVEFENGSVLTAGATSANAVRGGSFNLIYLDEFAFVPANLAEEFFASVYPTITAGKKTKLVITSTPKTFDLFYKLYEDAVSGNNNFVPMEAHWSEVPGRDSKWEQETINDIGQEKFDREYNLLVIGSTNTLISSAKLKLLPVLKPISQTDKFCIYIEPKEDRIYAMTVDVAGGTGGDYSAFVIFDITEFPYRVCAQFHDNYTDTLTLPTIIHDAAMKYNEAYILFELNYGQQVAERVYIDKEYTNVFKVLFKGRSGQILHSGFGGAFSKLQLGVNTGTRAKRDGCLALKALVEKDLLDINSYDIISELQTFVSNKKASWSAETGRHDDLAMCCVLFAWATTQVYFRAITDTDVRKKIEDRDGDEVSKNIFPAGFLGSDKTENIMTDAEGSIFDFNDPDIAFPDKEKTGWERDEFTDW